MDREQAIKTLAKYFGKHAGSVEQGLHDFTIGKCTRQTEFVDMEEATYNDKLSDICYNCEKAVVLKALLTKIKKKELLPYNVAFLQPSELDPVNWKDIIDRKINSVKALTDLPTIKSDPCEACGYVDFFYRQLQTRSADEPMTIFYICRNCGLTIRR